MKNIFQYILSIISYPFLKFNPSVISILGLVFGLMFFVFMVYQLYIAAFIALFGTVFDAVDGYVARKTGKVSKFGGFLDATLDRIADFLFITAFGYAGLVKWEIVVMALFTTMLVSYTRARAEATFLGNIKFDRGLLQRPGRIFLIGFSLFLFITSSNFLIFGKPMLDMLFLLISILNMLTVSQRVIAVYKN